MCEEQSSAVAGGSDRSEPPIDKCLRLLLECAAAPQVFKGVSARPFMEPLRRMGHQTRDVRRTHAFARKSAWGPALRMFAAACVPPAARRRSSWSLRCSTTCPAAAMGGNLACGPSIRLGGRSRYDRSWPRSTERGFQWGPGPVVIESLGRPRSAPDRLSAARSNRLICHRDDQPSMFWHVPIFCVLPMLERIRRGPQFGGVEPFRGAVI